MSTDKPPQNYDDLKKALDKLFGEWREAVSEDLRNKFVEDGAFPGYFEKEPKILFVGQEAHGCEGSCEPDSETYRKCKYKYNPSFKCEERKFMQYFLLDGNAYEDSNHPKRPKIAHLAAQITYGIQNQIFEWQKIPYPAGVSFAFMDVSKYANPNGPKTSVNFLRYVEESLGVNKSGRNFTREEIELLNPDLIITWNLKYKLAKEEEERDKKDKKDKKDKDEVFRKLFTESPDGPKKLDNSCGFLTDRAWVYKFDDGREIPLLDTWHFTAATSYWYKKDAETDIYNPIMKAVKELGVI